MFSEGKHLLQAYRHPDGGKLEKATEDIVRRSYITNLYRGRIDSTRRGGTGALAYETASAMLRESVRLPEREKSIVLGIVWQFRGQRDSSTTSK